MDYQNAVISAIDFIEDNLHEELTLDSVAARVAVSPYHFHRIFSSTLGESVKEYVRKRRLSEAANRLIESEIPILTIALDSRFDSQESFTRAFKKMFGTTPGAIRKQGKVQFLANKPRITMDMIKHLNEGVSMEPQFVTRERQLVIGMGGGFPEESFLKINALWKNFVQRKHEIKNQCGDYALGVCCPVLPQITKGPDDAFVYVAGLPVDSLEDIPDGMIGCELPASKYAVFTHRGPLTNLPQTVKYIWGTWVPKAGCVRKNAPDFELYDDRFDPESESGEFDIYIPIQ